VDSQIEEIKNRLNVLDIVGSYVKLTKTGVNYRGICPFHAEKGPSFFVSPTRQMFHCFGCGAGGDIFEFVKKIEGIEFGDALRILANKAGIELRRENPQLRSERQRLYEICDLACSFFEKQLHSGVAWGKEAKDYLLKRGITEASIKKWRLGYSPDTWQGLSDFLVGRGYTREEIVKAGLAVTSDKGNNPYDRFRGRIIFPIFDTNSQVIGFGARIFKDADKKETAKYINTPQTMLYDKSNVLYGINNAKLSIRKNNQAVLTEGYTDAIMAQQAGFENTVAVSGTALTGRHLGLLKRYSDNLLLSFDMDAAGDNATKRGINLAESQGFNIKVIKSYTEKDPADIIKDDPKTWEEAVTNARPIMDYYFDSSFAKYDKTNPDGKKQIGKIILPAIKRLQNKIEQSHWVQKLAGMLQVSETSVLEELKNIKDDAAYAPSAEVMAPAVTLASQPDVKDANGRKKLIEDKIVSLVLKDPENLNLIEEPHFAFFCDNTQNFIKDLKTGVADKEKYKNFFDTLALRAEVEYQEEDGCQEIQLCLLQLKDIELRNSLAQLSEAIRHEVDQQKKEYLIKEFDKKARELHQKS
jgi:DNA primase